MVIPTSTGTPAESIPTGMTVLTSIVVVKRCLAYRLVMYVLTTGT